MIIKHPRPKLGVSKCLEFEACRYNGVMISNDLVREMKPFVEFIPVCPEAEIGLGTPRPTVVLQSDGKSDMIDLYQPETDTIHTSKMLKLANDFVESNPDIDGFIGTNGNVSSNSHILKNALLMALYFLYITNSCEFNAREYLNQPSKSV